METTIFRCYVSFREGKLHGCNNLTPNHFDAGNPLENLHGIHWFFFRGFRQDPRYIISTQHIPTKKIEVKKNYFRYQKTSTQNFKYLNFSSNPMIFVVFLRFSTVLFFSENHGGNPKIQPTQPTGVESTNSAWRSRSEPTGKNPHVFMAYENPLVSLNNQWLFLVPLRGGR